MGRLLQLGLNLDFNLMDQRCCERPDPLFLSLPTITPPSSPLQLIFWFLDRKSRSLVPIEGDGGQLGFLNGQQFDPGFGSIGCTKGTVGFLLCMANEIKKSEGIRGQIDGVPTSGQYMGYVHAMVFDTGQFAMVRSNHLFWMNILAFDTGQLDSGRLLVNHWRRNAITMLLCLGFGPTTEAQTGNLNFGFEAYLAGFVLEQFQLWSLWLLWTKFKSNSMSHGFPGKFLFELVYDQKRLVVLYFIQLVEKMGAVVYTLIYVWVNLTILDDQLLCPKSDLETVEGLISVQCPAVKLFITQQGKFAQGVRQWKDKPPDTSLEDKTYSKARVMIGILICLYINKDSTF